MWYTVRGREGDYSDTKGECEERKKRVKERNILERGDGEEWGRQIKQRLIDAQTDSLLT